MSLFDRIITESFLSGDAGKRRPKTVAKAANNKFLKTSKHKKTAWKGAYASARKKNPGGGHHAFTRGVKRRSHPEAGNPRSGYERHLVKSREGQRRLKMKLQRRRSSK